MIGSANVADFLPKPVDLNRIYQDVVRNLWRPQPSHTLGNVKSFKAAGRHGRHLEEGEVPTSRWLRLTIIWRAWRRPVNEARQSRRLLGRFLMRPLISSCGGLPPGGDQARRERGPHQGRDRLAADENAAWAAIKSSPA